MDTRAFLGLEPTHNPFRWVLDVRPEVCEPTPAREDAVGDTAPA